MGMRLAGVTDETLYAKAKDILLQMGEMFQVQDDFLDCYGDPAVIGKVGTDIFDNKCSWLINIALQDASPAQRRTLEQNYAKRDAKAEKRVKEVFITLGMEAKFRAYEDKCFTELTDKINQLDGIPSDIFTQLLGRIYRREK